MDVGIREVRTHFTSLLRRVASGERIVITKRGRPVAMLIPPESEPKVNVGDVVREMLRSRDENGLKWHDVGTLRDLIEEGRRF